MDCPKEIESVLLEIIRIGTLRIRGAAANKDAEQCGIEASHIHNLPALLQNFSEELLIHYYRVEIRSFVTSSNPIYPVQAFEMEWSKLAKYIEVRRFAAPKQL